MADPKGTHLYVNLSAARTRKRLQGFGHGVRKVQSAGKNQALIIHTATGDHLSELESLFAEVGFASDSSQLSEPIDNLRNLGNASADWLRGVGVRTLSDLKDRGPTLTYMLVKRKYPQVSLNLLWALAAGLEGRDWRTLTDAEKRSLLAEIS